MIPIATNHRANSTCQNSRYRNWSGRGDSRGVAVCGARLPAFDRRREMKRIGLAAAVILAVVLAYAGFVAYEQRELRARLGEAIAAAGGRLGGTPALDVNAP